MYRALLLSLILASGCGGAPSGYYDGTLTITRDGHDEAVSTSAELSPNAGSVYLHVGDAEDYCNLGSPNWTGSDAAFACGNMGCWCSIGDDYLGITTASGKLEGDHLALTFSGQVEGGGAFSASFEGDNWVDNE